MSTYQLSRPVHLASGAIFQSVEVKPVLAGDLARIGDDIRTVARHFLAAAEAEKSGGEAVIAGNSEYGAMLTIVREMTSLGEDAERLDGADLDGLVAAVLFQEDAAQGE